MTRDEFARAYEASQGVTLEWLRAHGRDVRPCVCGEPDCHGWQMARLSGEDWPEDSPFPKSEST